MSGTRRMIVGEITHSNLRGKELADALDRELNNEQHDDEAVKGKESKKTVYGKS